MKFNLIDRILELTPGEGIRAHKALTASEEYLADHFPSFPVMPGVLMLECMVQAAGWLVRATNGFAHSMITLREARNVTYKSFVPPGRVLEIIVESQSIEDSGSRFVGKGFCDGVEVVKARFDLRHTNLADRDPAMAEADVELIDHARRQFALIGGEALVSAAGAVHQ